MIAVIKGDVNAKFSSCEEQAFLLRVLADGIYERTCSNTVGDRLPCLSVILRAIDVGPIVVEAMTIDRHISRGGIEARSLDHGDLAPIAEAGRGNVLPGLAAINGEMEQAGIAAHPDLVRFQRRWRDAVHHAKAALLRVLPRDGAGSLFAGGRGKGACKVRADRRPVESAVDGLHHVLRAE